MGIDPNKIAADPDPKIQLSWDEAIAIYTALKTTDRQDLIDVMAVKLDLIDGNKNG